MPITRSKKEEVISKLRESFKASDLLVFARFHGLSVAKASELRRKLREIGSSYIVAKKRLANIIFKEEGIEVPPMEGEVAFIFGGMEPIATAKEVQQFAKINEGLSIMGGVFEKKAVDSEVIVYLAKIPPRDVLVAQFLGVLQGPMRGLVGVMNGPQRGLVTALKQIADKA